jgi:hypothetical protein
MDTLIDDRAEEVAEVALRLLTAVHDERGTFAMACAAVGLDADAAIVRNALVLLVLARAIRADAAGRWSPWERI